MRLPVLCSERLRIRPFQRDDLVDCAKLFDEESTAGLAIEQRAEWLEWSVRNVPALENLMQPPYGDRAVIRRRDQRLVGSCGLVPSLVPLPREPSVAGPFGQRFLPEVGLYYHFAPAFRGRGYATEAASLLVSWAFANLKLSRIVATTTFENHASIRVMQRLGMTILRNPDSGAEWPQVVGVLEWSDEAKRMHADFTDRADLEEG